MRKLPLLVLATLILIFSASPVFAHEVGSKDNSAQGLVKQAIAFLEGIHSAETASMDIQNATQAKALNPLGPPGRSCQFSASKTGSVSLGSFTGRQ